MKKVLLACLVGAITLNALAADTVDMKVAGTLSTSGCTPTVDSNGVDFGTIKLSSLNAGSVNQLGYRDTTLTINCYTPTAVGITGTDNRADSVQLQKVGGANGNATYDYGLGKTANGVNLGAYVIVVNPTADDIIADGVAHKFIYKYNVENIWRAAGAESYLYNDNTVFYSVGNVGAGPIAIKNAVFPIRIRASIQGTDTLAITDETKLDGLATISLVYQ